MSKMSKLDIVKKTIKNKDCPVMPYHITFFSVMEKKIKDYFGVTDMDGLVGNYIKWLGIKGVWTKAEEELEKDKFGVLWRTNPLNRGNIVEPFLKEPDLNKIQIPDYTIK